MSAARDFDALVFAYLDGDATPEQVVAIRDALRRDPALRLRLSAMVRLHRAQSAALVRSPREPLAAALAALRAFGERAGRCLAHACVLALVVVELDVAVPGVDRNAWLEPEAGLAAETTVAELPELPATEDLPSEEDVDPMPDVREADFLES